jgi:hypothetical protein
VGVGEADNEAQDTRRIMSNDDPMLCAEHIFRVTAYSFPSKLNPDVQFIEDLPCNSNYQMMFHNLYNSEK